MVVWARPFDRPLRHGQDAVRENGLRAMLWRTWGSSGALGKTLRHAPSSGLVAPPGPPMDSGLRLKDGGNAQVAVRVNGLGARLWRTWGLIGVLRKTLRQAQGERVGGDASGDLGCGVMRPGGLAVT